MDKGTTVFAKPGGYCGDIELEYAPKGTCAQLAAANAEIERIKRCYESATGKPVCGSGAVIRVECKQMTAAYLRIAELEKRLQEAEELPKKLMDIIKIACDAIQFIETTERIDGDILLPFHAAVNDLFLNVTPAPAQATEPYFPLEGKSANSAEFVTKAPEPCPYCGKEECTKKGFHAVYIDPPDQATEPEIICTCGQGGCKIHHEGHYGAPATEPGRYEHRTFIRFDERGMKEDMVLVRRDDLEIAVRWAEGTDDNDSSEYDRLKAALEGKEKPTNPE